MPGNIDSRVLQKQIDLLEEQKEMEQDTGGSLEEEAECRLTHLYEVKREVGSEWNYGVLFIHEDNLAEYAEEYARDVAGSTFDEWPFNHIDWDEAAKDLQHDLLGIEIEGETYYYLS